MLEKNVTYHHGNLKTTLLEAGHGLVREGGPDALSLRAVARQAGVSQTAPYRHFTDKEELLAAIAEQGFNLLSDAMEDELRGESDHVERLHCTGRSYLRFARENPHLFRLMFGPLVTKEEEHPDLVSTCKGCFSVLERVIAEGQAAGVFREGDVEALSMSAWAMVHGLAHLTIDGQVLKKKACAQDEEAFGRAMGTLLIEGLRPR